MKKKILMISLFLALIGSATAGVIDFYDSWEDGDASEYNIRDPDDSAVYGVDTTTATDGSYSAWMEDTSSSGGGHIRWTRPTSVTDGNFSTKIYFDPTADNVKHHEGYVLFGKENSEEMYMAGLKNRGGNDQPGLSITKYNVTGGPTTDLAEKTLSSFPKRSWQEIVLEKDGKDVTLYWYDNSGNLQDSLSHTLSTNPDPVAGQMGDMGSGQTGFIRFDELNVIASNAAPSINSVNKTPSSPKLNDNVSIAADVTDDNSVSSVEGSYSKDGTVQSSGDSFTNTVGDTWEISDWIQVDEADSLYEYTISATDDDGETTTYTDSFYVNDSSAGLKVAKPKNITYNDATPPYDVYLNDDGDDVEDETASCDLKLDGSTFTSFILTEGGAHETGSLPSQSDGNYQFTAACTEDQGNQTLTNIDRFFQIDTGAPALNITRPDNRTENTQGIPLEYTVSDPNLDTSSCKYQKDGGTNISISNCGNTTFSVGSVGDHNVTVWAKDTLGNWGSDTKQFFADYENRINATDAESGSTLSEFEVSVTNGTKTVAGSTVDGTYEFFTSNMPKGDVNLTVKKEGYVTNTESFTGVDNSFTLRKEYQMNRAGFTWTVKDEQSDTKLNYPLLVTINNGQNQKEVAYGNRFDTADGRIDDPGNAFDQDTSTKTDDSQGTGGDNNGNSQISGFVSLTNSQGNELNIKIKCGYEHNSQPQKVEMYKNGAWNTVDDNPLSQLPNDACDQNQGPFTLTYTIDNSDGSYSGLVRYTYDWRHDDNDAYYHEVFEIWANNVNAPDFDIQDIPSGEDTKVTFDDNGFNDYKGRTYTLNLDQFSKVNLDAYLLRNGDGIYMTVKTINSEGEGVNNAKVDIQRQFGSGFKTVSQKKTTGAGEASFYLDPDVSYRAVVSHPNYVAFEGTFSPVNYQYDPLTIQLGSTGLYNFTTRWDSISYKLEPDVNTLEPTGNQTFNWTVTDSQSDLSEFGLKLWHNGSQVQSDRIISSPSGGKLNVTEDLTQYEDGEQIKLEGYFLTGGEMYSLNRTITIRKGFDQGVFSINAILYEIEKSTDQTTQGFLALIITLLVGVGTGSSGFTSKKGGGFLALMTLGLFTWRGWFPGFIFILALLLLGGVWMRRG